LLTAESLEEGIAFKQAHAMKKPGALQEFMEHTFETTPFGISPSCYDSRRMECPTARILFENYAKAAVELFESADKLATLVGQHDQFAEAKKYSKQTHEKCYSARLALKQHQAEHGCREGVANEL
jgi:hypothetical protein